MTLEELKKSGVKITKIKKAFFPRQCKKRESIVQELVSVLDRAWKTSPFQEKKYMFFLNDIAREYLNTHYGDRYEPLHKIYSNKNGEQTDIVGYEILDMEKIERKIVNFTHKTIRMTAWVLENDEIMCIRTNNMKPNHINNENIIYPESLSHIVDEIVKLIKQEIKDLTNDYKGTAFEIKKQQELLKNTIIKHKKFVKKIKQSV